MNKNELKIIKKLEKNKFYFEENNKKIKKK